MTTFTSPKLLTFTISTHTVTAKAQPGNVGTDTVVIDGATFFDHLRPSS